MVDGERLSDSGRSLNGDEVKFVGGLPHLDDALSFEERLLRPFYVGNQPPALASNEPFPGEARHLLRCVLPQCNGVALSGFMFKECVVETALTSEGTKFNII